jgi:hypothetical protein
VRALASVPDRVGEERATTPPVVLPITSQGLAVTDRFCWALLGMAMVVAAALILYLDRGTTFFADELTFVYETPSLGAGDVLDPHNGHLIATTRLVYKAILETIGADYVAFRVLALCTVVLSAGLFYVLVKRRIGALPALAPTLVLLFLGSAWQHVVAPIGFTPIFAIAMGLAALLALEHSDRGADLAACALLVVSVASYTTGVPFLVGAAISVLLRADRRRRLWIFLIPLALYAAWWLWSLSTGTSSGEETRLANVLLIPSWTVESLATVTAALSGLGFSFQDNPLQDAAASRVDSAWGYVLAVLVLVALVLRIRRGNVPAAMWATLGIVLTWWALGALAFDVPRPPDSVRYVYLGSVGVLLVAAAAAGSVRFSRLGLVALFGACVISVASNGTLLRDRSAVLRNVSATERAEFAMLELARPEVDPGFNSGEALGTESPFSLIDDPAAAYFEIVDRYGSLALPLDELGSEPEGVRAYADRVLAAALALRLETQPPPTQNGCERTRSPDGGQTIALELPSGGASLRPKGAREVPVKLGRFASAPAAELGSLSAGEAATLTIPPDASPTPWRASLTGATAVTVCPLT